jgi:putative hydrolase of the HAD superfamily
VVLFDLGWVLAEPVDLTGPLAALLGVPEAELDAVYYTHRQPYDQGLPDRDYWVRTTAELGVTVDLEALLPTLVETDMSGWSTIRPGAEAILHDLRANGVRIAVLSNAPAAFAEAAESLPWRHLAERWYFSAPLGLTKPDPAIYRHVEQDLGRTGADLWFVDDRLENVLAAQDRGWHAHLWKSDADTRSWLEREGFLG